MVRKSGEGEKNVERGTKKRGKCREGVPKWQEQSSNLLTLHKLSRKGGRLEVLWDTSAKKEARKKKMRRKGLGKKEKKDAGRHPEWTFPRGG